MIRETAVLEYVGPQQKDWEIVTQLPNGKPHRLLFNEKNGYKVETNLILSYFDSFRKQDIVLNENYPLSLLNAYGPKSKNPVLKLVERKKYDELETDPLEKFKASDSKEPQKGKKDE